MNKLFVFAFFAFVAVACLKAEEHGLDNQAEDDGVHVDSNIGVREKRAVSCRSVSSQPNNPGTYYEACRAHCILNGKRGGSCSGGSCSCY
ncbi:hypothetical protein FQR65_LT17298 [Abscondita terminalis]|nr:hypothetical protein FQR65_LT17298 [Abscondita terminalis]